MHTFATANRLMDEYPEFLFGYSQPASYEAVARRSPEMMHAVRRRIAKTKKAYDEGIIPKNNFYKHSITPEYLCQKRTKKESQ